MSATLHRRTLLGTSVLGALIAVARPAGSAEADPHPHHRSRLAGLIPLQPRYPRAWYFRQVEVVPDPAVQTAWDAALNSLGGVEGKLVREEVDTANVLRSWVEQFKRDHPDQWVLLHYNGLARRTDDRLVERGYFPGHWLHVAGADLTEAAASGATTLTVDPALADRFATELARDWGDATTPRTLPVDLTIVARRRGALDWSRCDHLRLTGVSGSQLQLADPLPRSYGTSAYVAPLVRIQTPDLAKLEDAAGDGTRYYQWAYNFSDRGPRHPRDHRRCADVLVDDLTSLMGELCAVDGIEFDVDGFSLSGETRTNAAGVSNTRQMLQDEDRTDDYVPAEHVDSTFSGTPDAAEGTGYRGAGFDHGINRYGLGKVAFHAALRSRLGPDRLIMGDGFYPEMMQRSFASLNGMESEGFPTLPDQSMQEWTGGLDRLLFWNAFGRTPAASYLVVKWNNFTTPSSAVYLPRMRLNVAASCFADAGVTFGTYALDAAQFPAVAAVEGRPARTRVFDELWGGTLRTPGWLGEPVEAPQWRATQGTDRWAGSTLDLTAREQDGWSTSTGAPQYRFELGTLDGPDLFVEWDLRSTAALPHYPASIRRRVTVHLETAAGDLVPGSDQASYFASTGFVNRFAWRGLDAGQGYRVVALVEGGGGLISATLRGFQEPNIVTRRYANGVVLANVSDRQQGIALPTGRSYRRLQRTYPGAALAGEVNTGAKVAGPTLTVAARDAIFLRVDEVVS